MSDEPSIELLNVVEGETFAYPLVLLECQFNCSWDIPENVLAELQIGSVATYWPVARSGRFKAVVRLPTLGQHDIVLNVAETYLFFTVVYQPRETQHIIRFYYQKSKGSDGTFDAPPETDNSETMALAKVQFNAMLMQSAMAELMRAHGFGRETFALELDGNGQPIVHLLETSFTNEEIRSSKYIDQDVFAKVAEDIETLGFHTDDRQKHAIILGCSHFNPETKKTEAHLALGGGKIGQFGSCTLHTWASHEGELSKCFLDNTRIPPTLLDDSCGRKANWANYSTGIGAFFHELGHSLGLGHSKEGIMSRGFDNFNYIFTVYEPLPITHNHQSNPTFTHSYNDGKLILDQHQLMEINGFGGGRWHRASALKLHHSEWISASAAPTSSTKPSITWRRDVFGPVGEGTFDGDQVDFGLDTRGQKDIAGFLITSGMYCDRIDILTTSTLNDLLMAELSVSGSQDLFILMDGEYILKIDVFAVAWVDGFRLHTNYRTTRVFGGGKGMAVRSFVAPPGHYFSSLFGSHGAHHVGKLGAFASPLPPNVRVELPQIIPTQSNSGSGLLTSINSFFSSVTSTQSNFRAVGAGAHDGDQDAFSFKDMGAILITCAQFVMEFKHLSVQDYQQQFAAGYFCKQDEHVFALGPGEYLTQVDVRSGAWIDAVRFLTNKRISPWYGGDGGTESSFVCPPGTYINGFYGSHGGNYVGTLGATYTALPATPPPAPTSPQLSKSYQGIKGINVVVNSSGIITAVDSFESIPDSTEGTFFLLRSGEAFVQMDVCRDGDAIVGFCLHTPFRSSKWFGKITEKIEFIIAPENSCISQLHLVGSDLRHSFFQFEGVDSPLDGTQIHVDAGDANIEIKSPEGIAFLVFCETNNGDSLVHKVLEWPTTVAYPTRWFISYDLFRHYVGDNLSGFTINPVDKTGGEAYSKCLPVYLTA